MAEHALSVMPNMAGTANLFTAHNPRFSSGTGTHMASAVFANSGTHLADKQVKARKPPSAYSAEPEKFTIPGKCHARRI
jgi:xylose isomerase